MKYFVADVLDSNRELVKRYLYGVAITELYRYNNKDNIMSTNDHINYIRKFVNNSIKNIPHPNNCIISIKIMSYKNIIKYKIPFQVFDPPGFAYLELQANARDVQYKFDD